MHAMRINDNKLPILIQLIVQKVYACVTTGIKLINAILTNFLSRGQRG